MKNHTNIDKAKNPFQKFGGISSHCKTYRAKMEINISYCDG